MPDVQFLRMPPSSDSIMRAGGILLIALVTGLTLIACEGKEAAKDIQPASSITNSELNLKKINNALRVLKESYHADDSWRTLMKQNYVWSADLQKSLIREDAQPIAGTGILHDVELREGKAILRIRQPFDIEASVNANATLEFRLTCDIQQELRKPPEISSDLYRFGFGPATHAFVARIRSVKRYDALVAGQPDGDDSNYSIQIDGPPHFVAYGDCIKLQYLNPE